jgi:hypothetical protein
MKVAVVVDPCYSGLADLRRVMPVWAVDTPSNRSLATQIWRSPEYSQERGLTLYNIGDVAATEENCLSEIDMIELHHPQTTALLLIGLSDTATLRSGLEELGYSLEKSGGDILACRSSHDQIR